MNTSLIFEHDSVPVGIDSCTSATVCGARQMFIGELEPVLGLKLEGATNTSIPIVGRGTLLLTFVDDAGQTHQHKVHNAYYAPRLKLTLLSPRQWSNQGPKKGRSADPVRTTVLRGDKVELHFEKDCIKTIDYDAQLQIPLLMTKPGYKSFSTHLCSQHLTAREARIRPTALTIGNVELPAGSVLRHQEDRELLNQEMDNKNYEKDPFDLRGETAPILADTIAGAFEEPALEDFNFESILSEDWDSTAPEARLPSLNETDKRTLMLRWHYRLGHMPFSHLKASAAAGLLDPRLATVQEHPFCPGCQFGKATRRPWRHRSKKKDGSRKKLRQAAHPGDVVSVDTAESRNVPGLVAQLRGRPTLMRYHYATTFVDHFSDLDYVHLHQRNDGDSILEAKLAFERYAGTFGVSVKHYHCDNGVFADTNFKTACRAARQTSSFCGVNAHHQNGKAEKRIRDIRDSARSMLLLAQHNWPAAITANLWGFAMIYASQIRNSTLREGEKRTALQKFANTDDRPDVKQFHTFGCPVYNLDPKLQSGNSLENKWCDRARIGIYLGLSREHAHSVSLVLNPDTGLTSPQFHVKHDERFETTKIPAMRNVGKWQGITRIHETVLKPKRARSNKRTKLSHTPVSEPIDTTQTPTPESNGENGAPVQESMGAHSIDRNGQDRLGQPERNGRDRLAHDRNGRDRLGQPERNGQDRLAHDRNGRDRLGQPERNGRDRLAHDRNGQDRLGQPERNGQDRLAHDRNGEDPMHTQQENEQLIQRETPASSQRETQSDPQRETQLFSQREDGSASQRETERVSFQHPALQGTVNSQTQAIQALKAHKSSSQKRKRGREEMEETETATSLEEHRREMQLTIRCYKTEIAREVHAEELVEQCMTSNPFAFAATLADEDTMYLNQAKKEPDWVQFHEAMVKEIQDHTEGKHWEVVPRSSMPEGHRAMRGVWSMKRKRRVGTGEVYKWKARLCIDGSSQEKGVNYWETYSPVVGWETIRSLLTLAILNGWTTRQIDFVLAFPQAEVECPMYMEIPKECYVDGSELNENNVLLLKKNLYGTKQASRVWFEFLKEGLEEIGFVQSSEDKAVFYKGETIFVVYVDDGILMGPNGREIDDVIGQLGHKYKLTDEGDLNEYLGIKMKRTKDGRELTQPALIQRILQTVGVSLNRGDRQEVKTPATKTLHKDEGGEKRRMNWDYRSVVGMLNWLARSTRPELIFAVSQVGRFMAFPKKSHEDAIMRICTYLRDTRDKGMIMKPDKNKGFEVYADADFAGGYNKHNAEDPATAKSRTCYHIMFNNCLVYSHSKLQTEIALSTTEAEYICLSQALRTVISLMRFFKELAKKIKSFKYKRPRFKCKAFEDNNGAIAIATTENLRPRTKHINIKYHHFKRYVRKGYVTIERIDTIDQLADIGTKPLLPHMFIPLRKALIGW